jgi:hypothetical protein
MARRTETRLTGALSPALCALMVAALVTACEAAVEPTTGERSFQVTIPGTAAHGDRLEDQWERCLRFRSPSVCSRRLPAIVPSARPAPANASAPADPSVQPPQ